MYIDLEKRAIRCYYQNGRRYCQQYRSAWSDWARWVVLVVLIVGFLLLFILCSCITARRRRKAGQNPYYGTGWAARHGPVTYNPSSTTGTNPSGTYNAQPYYNNNATTEHNAAPPYSPSNQGYYGQSQGYGGQQSGIELQGSNLQNPQPTYQPPAGPPPGKQGF
ncbi:hypothetical protein W97_03113 [Coniosporium apollinis CBS 100218]|uniref:Chitin synthesis regulation, Congo red resistance, RCR protein n=1 Tax=Coniosporium apollinis (strain CBS 100218) TaxID=1168221 RepID=R7YPM9_CONA1|nr:uncharacterized protein W97_03113 [Coniosporium apollinis CBS 100218]EON63885.1 hypothetical protein W97_03113 [Coniosporium apollinis CBS 100218]